MSKLGRRENCDDVLISQHVSEHERDLNKAIISVKKNLLITRIIQGISYGFLSRISQMPERVEDYRAESEERDIFLV